MQRRIMKMTAGAAIVGAAGWALYEACLRYEMFGRVMQRASGCAAALLMLAVVAVLASEGLCCMDDNEIKQEGTKE